MSALIPATQIVAPRRERGAAVVEYAVLVTAMALVVLATTMFLGDKLSEIVNNIFINI